MDALELALKCSSLLIRSMSSRSGTVSSTEGLGGQAQQAPGSSLQPELPWSESDFEKHFKDHGIITSDMMHSISK